MSTTVSAWQPDGRLVLMSEHLRPSRASRRSAQAAFRVTGATWHGGVVEDHRGDVALARQHRLGRGPQQRPVVPRRQQLEEAHGREARGVARGRRRHPPQRGVHVSQ